MTKKIYCIVVSFKTENCSANKRSILRYYGNNLSGCFTPVYNEPNDYCLQDDLGLLTEFFDTGKNCFVTATKLGTTNIFLLLQPKILLQQPNVLLIEVNILML